jgi:hypothetical protein
MSRGSVVSVMIRLGVGNSKNWGSISGGSKRVTSCSKRPAVFGTHPASYAVVTGSALPGGKAYLGSISDH